tara:strand:- start:1215 stop:1691 length:477 start_codon:yes stop_codon:yes gene_type:complete
MSKHKVNKKSDIKKPVNIQVGPPILDSRCRNATSLLSFYLTELNGINVIIKSIILGVFFKIYMNNKLNNKFILVLLVILTLHLILHICIIIISLPQICDSSNFDWKYAGKFDSPMFIFCHKKYELYYSNYFWILDSVLPNIFLLIISYYILQKGYKFN